MSLPANTSLRVSVVIPTLGRGPELLDTLKGLATQTRPPDEVLVADQNEPPLPCTPQIDELLARIPGSRRLRSSLRGVVPNMNLLLREAKGDVVIFVDDDVLPIPGLVAAHLANYERPDGDRIGIVAGRLEQPGDDDPRAVHRTGAYGRWTGQVTAGFNALPRGQVRFAQGANMSARRSALVEAGGFDEGFDGNGYFFEPDACMRVGALGYEVIFDPETSIRHLQAPAGGTRIHDKAVHTSHFTRNGVRLYRRHARALGLPAYVGWLAAYALAKAIYNRDPRIVVLGWRGIVDGLKRDLRVRGC